MNAAISRLDQCDRLRRVDWSDSPPESEPESPAEPVPALPRAVGQADRRSRQPHTASATDRPSPATAPPTQQSPSSAVPPPATTRLAPALPWVQACPCCSSTLAALSAHPLPAPPGH